MLRALHIENVVLIEKLALDIAPGLIALTGETGAGKSIILDSLALVLGARADTGMIRQGADNARVLAEFDLPVSHPVWAEIDADPSEPLIITRTLSREGKSRATLNERPVAVETLRKLSAYLVDIHSQFETHALLEPMQHRALLDRALNDQKLIDDVAGTWEKWRALEDEKTKLEAAQEKAKLLEEQWKADLELLDELQPKEGEESELLDARGKAQKSGRMAEAYDESANWLNGDESAADKALNRAWKALSRLPEDPMLATVQAQIDQAVSLVRDASAQLEDMRYALAGMPDAEKIDDRLHALRAAARRLNVVCDLLPVRHAEIAESLSKLSSDDAALAKLIKNIAAARDAFMTKADSLSKARIKRGKALAKSINDELPPLKLERASFSIDIAPLDESAWGPFGTDRVQFMAAMNTGQSASPLHKTASGGELSRLLLAIKMVLADVQPVLVFDEIDQGVGGATAAAIGARLKRLSETYQVIVVTHSAQVAASANAHYVVQKAVQDKTTRVAVTELPGLEARRNEVARMLSGSVVTNEARAAADKLLEASQ